MTVHLYLSLMPEALIASMLNPNEFGTYYAVGSSKKRRGQAMFVELDPDFRHDYFRIEEAIARCVSHSDGRPKKSVYVSAYRVLEHIPLQDVDTLFLVSQYGETLPLARGTEYPHSQSGLYMYQELAPVSPLVVSSLDPHAFYKLVTQDPASMIHLPATCFVDLRLDELATDPDRGSVGDLPYTNLPHLRECLVELRDKTIHTKMVNRTADTEFAYRTIASGIYIGNQEELAFFPLPSRPELRSTHYTWWRSAN